MAPPPTRPNPLMSPSHACVTVLEANGVNTILSDMHDTVKAYFGSTDDLGFIRAGITLPISRLPQVILKF
jgi:hypothetical protein